MSLKKILLINTFNTVPIGINVRVKSLANIHSSTDNLYNLSDNVASTEITNDTLIISLTSYPKRIKYVKNVLESLCKQDACKSDYHIVLVLAEPEFPNKEGDLPKDLVNFIYSNNIELIWYYRNIRSHKKLMPVLQKYPENPILITDDDVIRPYTWISMFINDHKKYPNDIICGATKCWLDKDYTWQKYVNVTKSFKVGRVNYIPNVILNTGRPMNGFGGTLYPPHTFTDERFFDEDKMMELSPTSDESWQWCFNIIENRVIRQSSVIRDYSQDIIRGSQETALCKENDHKYENIFKTLCDAFPDLKENIDKRLEESNHKYAIVTIVNDSFVIGLKTMLFSLFRHNNWYNGDLIVLYNDDYSPLSDSSKKVLSNLFKNILFRKIDSEKYTKIDLNNIPIKFIAPIIKFEIFGLDEYEKVLYLDADMLILGDIKGFFTTTLNLVMCTHERYLVQKPLNWNKIYDNTIKTNLNNGMIMISKKYLDKKHVDGLLNLAYIYDKSFPGYRGCPDQDIMLAYFLQNNILVTLFNNIFNTMKRVFANGKKKLTNEKIIHYIMNKPWNSNEPEYRYINSIWWSYNKKLNVKKC